MQNTSDTNKQGNNSNTEQKTENHSGIISISSRGIGYIEIDEQEDDIEIQNENLKTALNRDEVSIVLLSQKIQGRTQGKVVSIIHRAKMEFVGTVTKKNNKTLVVSDDKRMYAEIELSQDESKNLQERDKVLVKIVEWKDQTSSPQGKLIKNIGVKGEHNAEIESIVLDKGFDIEFPSEVEAEADKLKEESEHPEYWNTEAKKRKDMRGTLTFTIDPADAKDFDDAISIKKTATDTFEIGVHIADVSHYVTEGSELNKEARKRGTSVYLVDRTIPMLPEILSNNLCSLNPNVDRLTFSSIFVIEYKDGKVTIKDRWFGKTVINSDTRFSYEDAQKVLNEKQGLHREELQTLWGIAQILRAEKFKLGAIDFEADEVKFVLDEKGHPIRVYKKERLDTHKLVEEFMLLANREVAEFFFKEQVKHKLPLSFLYRIHDKPDPEKLTNLSIFLKALGYELKVTDKITSKDISAVLKKIEGKAEESLIKTATIRSMSKAVYSTGNIGHFGLAFQYYTHFTSPIRRYPDLIVHRVLFQYLTNGTVGKSELAQYKKIGEEASNNEVRAAEAERASIKLKQVEYMKDKVGEIFDGIISGVTEWGIYVEETNTRCEGMIKLRDLGGDFYTLDQKNYAIIGQKTKKKYSLGDKVKFKVVSGDLERRTLDYVLAN